MFEHQPYFLAKLSRMMYLCFMNKKVFIEDLGFKDYKDTWEYQEELLKES